MAEPTNTRTLLRQAICRSLRMEFFRRVGNSSVFTGTPTTTTVDDTKLTQSDDFWNNYWLLITSGGQLGSVRRVSDFISGSDRLVLEYALASAPAAGDSYELHSIWSANELHEALNEAIEDAFPAFFDTITDETLVVTEDDTTYSLTGLATSPYLIAKIFMERNPEVTRGVADVTGVTFVRDDALIGKLASVTTDWLVSVYAGTGRGQARAVASVDNGTGQVNTTTSFSPVPVAGDKYALWNPQKEKEDWWRILAARFDAKLYPDTLYLTRTYPDFYGLRMRLQYTARPVQLTAEGSTTVVPYQFIINKTLSNLYGQMVNDNRVDRARYAGLADDYMRKANEFRLQRHFRPPDVTLWQEQDESPWWYFSHDRANPLGW